jgi:hypothetical protein
MKHVKDAQKLLDEGNTPAALAVLESVLSLAPRNTEALRLKARILDGWGRFEESLLTLHALSQAGKLTEVEISDLENRAIEEKEAIVYSELSAEGRWYFAFPRAQIAISLYGFLGCATFLLLSPGLLSSGIQDFWRLAGAFCFFVLFPWLALLVVHFTGVKRILVGVHGLRVCHRLSSKEYPWATLGKAVVEYDTNPIKGHLKLYLYPRSESRLPLLAFDISEQKSVVKARRHFVRNILSYLDVVCYLPKQAEGLKKPQEDFAAAAKTAQLSPAAQEKDQNTDSVA